MSSTLLPASAAAARLGVKRATLYAYVSRGLLTRLGFPGRRGSWFDPLELDALARRARDPAERPPGLRIASAITLIERGRYWYRGRSPGALAASLSFEAVAEWLWTGERPQRGRTWTASEDAAARARQALAALPDTAPATDRIRLVVTVLGAADPLRFDLRPVGAVATARRLIATTVTALSTRRRGSVAARVASWLAAGRSTPADVAAIERALIVMADHEMAASTLAVRVAASFRADPYAAVAAGLGAMAGAWHGAASRRVEAMLDEVARGVKPEEALGRCLGEDSGVPGFGHPLYRDGDPRVALLWPLTRTAGRVIDDADAVLVVAAKQGLPPPNVDFALAVLARALRLKHGAAEALFTMGRLAGWLAHAIEEYTNRTDFRLRAVYAGQRPE